MGKPYKPSARTAAILDAARGYVESVDYDVTLRWCFYRLLQDGFYSTKKDYKNKWKGLASTARRAHYQDWWNPCTFVDDGRSIVHVASGSATASEAIQEARERSRRFSYVELDHFYYQPATIVWMFEAQGMVGQFRKYAPCCDLIPLGGDPSFPLKQETANHLSELVERYGRPVTVLYAGDYDSGGLRIPETTMKDVVAWSRYPDLISLERVGINPSQASTYGIHKAPDGTIQWEALGDAAAGELIKSAMAGYVDYDLIAKISKASRLLTGNFIRR